MKTNFYIDGFNLYYRALRNTPFRWLNLALLCSNLLPDHEVGQIRYFTAKLHSLPHNPGQPKRQGTYLRALKTIPNLEIIYGHFIVREATLLRVNPKPGEPKMVRVQKFEEKGTDVNIAVRLIEDGLKGEYEQAVLITNDGDLRDAIRVVKENFNLPVGIVAPSPKKMSKALGREATFVRTIKKSALRKSQFPRMLTDEDGRFYKPRGW